MGFTSQELEAALRLREFSLREEAVTRAGWGGQAKDERIFAIGGERGAYLKRLPSGMAEKAKSASEADLARAEWRALSIKTTSQLESLSLGESELFGEWFAASKEMKRLNGRFLLERLEGSGRAFDGEGELERAAERYAELDKRCSTIRGEASDLLKNMIESAESDLRVTRPQPTNEQLTAALSRAAEEILAKREFALSSSEWRAERETRFYPFGVADGAKQRELNKFRDSVDKRLTLEKTTVALEIARAQREIVDEIYVSPRYSGNLTDSVKNDCIYFLLEAAEKGLEEKIAQLKGVSG